ncbi:MAG TPA: hypothetical protein VFX98_14405 [Longimicrobiaceae bacterium]|nr:hypothetical protein [Longimicrobiaceae bacterium]
MLGACDRGGRAPACDAEETRALAAQRGLSAIALRGGSREVPGRPDLLVTSGNDTLRFRTRGPEVLMTSGQEQFVATLAEVATTGEEEGGWSCSADLIAVNMTTPSRSLPRVPISYTSVRGEGGSHEVFVQVRADLMRPQGP